MLINSIELVPASRFTIEQLTAIYNQTRVDYLVPMPMNARRLQEYITAYDVRLEHSLVAMHSGEACWALPCSACGRTAPGLPAWACCPTPGGAEIGQAADDRPARKRRPAGHFLCHA